MNDHGYPGSSTTGTVTTPTWNSCRWCGCVHVGGGICPRVKLIEYYENGTIKRVEFHEQAPVLNLRLNQLAGSMP